MLPDDLHEPAWGNPPDLWSMVALQLISTRFRLRKLLRNEYPGESSSVLLQKLADDYSSIESGRHVERTYEENIAWFTSKTYRQRFMCFCAMQVQLSFLILRTSRHSLKAETNLQLNRVSRSIAYLEGVIDGISEESGRRAKAGARGRKKSIASKEPLQIELIEKMIARKGPRSNADIVADLIHAEEAHFKQDKLMALVSEAKARAAK